MTNQCTYCGGRGCPHCPGTMGSSHCAHGKAYGMCQTCGQLGLAVPTMTRNIGAGISIGGAVAGAILLPMAMSKLKRNGETTSGFARRISAPMVFGALLGGVIGGGASYGVHMYQNP